MNLFISVLLAGVVLLSCFSIRCGGLESLEWLSFSEAQLVDDYESVGYPQDSGGGPIVQWSLSARVSSTGRNYTIHVGSLTSGLPNAFSFQLPEGGQSICP